MVHFSEVIKNQPQAVTPSKPASERAAPAASGVALGRAITPEQLYYGLRKFMKEVGQQVQNNAPFDFRKGLKLVDLILESSEETIEDLEMLTLLADEPASSLSTHASNIAINSIVIGKGLGYYKSRLRDLVTAALFHELGMYMVPETIRKKNGALSEEEYAIIKEHPLHAYEILTGCGDKGREIAEIVLQEHERGDGSGYPKGLKAEAIHEHAFIIGLLDIYESMIHSRTYRKRLPPPEAMKTLIRRSKGLFPKNLIKTLLKELSIYPVKSYVRLNNNSVGMVIKTNPMWPLKPIISIIFDAQGKKLEGERRITDLSETPLLFIKDVIPENEVDDFT